MADDIVTSGRTLLVGPVLDIVTKDGYEDSKIHLEWCCDGLERVSVCVDEDEQQSCGGWGTEEVALSLLCTLGARLCRMCALEYTLDLAGRTKVARTNRRAVMFSGQPVAENRKKDFTTSQSGVARLRRVAARMELSVVETELGPVAWGHVSPLAERLITNSLRALPRKWARAVAKLPDEAIPLWWGLWLSHQDEDVEDLLEIAAQLCV